MRSVPRTLNINGALTRVLNSPAEYFQKILALIASAQNDIVLSALYCGTGAPEQRIIAEIERALGDGSRPNLKCTFILDHSRAQRSPSNLDEMTSLQLLSPLLTKFGNRTKVLLYRMPRHFGFLNSIIPGQLSEILGVYHCKFCIFDQTVILTGANLSSEYLTNRQDRYIVVDQSANKSSRTNLLYFLQSFVQIIDPYCCHVKYDASSVKAEHRNERAGGREGIHALINRRATKLSVNEPVTKDSFHSIFGEKLIKLSSVLHPESLFQPTSCSTTDTSSSLQTDATSDSYATVTSLRPLVQHYSCGVRNESELLLDLLLPSLASKTMSTACLISQGLSYLSSLVQTNAPLMKNTNVAIAPLIDTTTAVSANSETNCEENYIGGAAINESNDMCRSSMQNIQDNILHGRNNRTETDNGILLRDDVVWSRMVVASPYPTFLPQFTSSLISLSKVSSTREQVHCKIVAGKIIESSKKIDARPTGSKLESNKQSQSFIENMLDRTEEDSVKHHREDFDNFIESDDSFCLKDQYASSSNKISVKINDKNGKNETMMGNLTNDHEDSQQGETDDNHINDLKDTKNKENSRGNHRHINTEIGNNSKFLDMKIIVSADESHGFFSGSGLKKLIPKMHSYALQSVLLQSLRSAGTIIKIVGVQKSERTRNFENTNVFNFVLEGKKLFVENVRSRCTSLFSTSFSPKIMDTSRSYSNMTVCPYYRKGWTFHAKGIWLFASAAADKRNVYGTETATGTEIGTWSDMHPLCKVPFSVASIETKSKESHQFISSNSNMPIQHPMKRGVSEHVPLPFPLAATYIGSSNFGERSYGRDFELGFVLHSNCPLLASKLSEECARLEEHSSAMTMGVKEYSLQAEGAGTDWYIPLLTKMLRKFL